MGCSFGAPATACVWPRRPGIPFAAEGGWWPTGAHPSRSLLIGGLLCALAGLELALGGLTIFSPNMTSGRGYIAFVAVVFGAAHPIGAAAAGLFFGFVDAVGIRVAGSTFGDAVPGEAILGLPFVLTIVAVVVSGRLRKPRPKRPPDSASCGRVAAFVSACQPTSA